jgi:predicted MFS family arabinose efflux permease
LAPIKKLFTREFLALNGIIFLVFCNVAVFFQFQNYLQEGLHFPAHSLGFLIGIFAFTALIVRPLISPFIHSDNARKWLFLSTLGVILALFLYYPARGFWSMTLVRVFHGGIYVVLATAALTKMMDSIPEGQSGQAFGLITVITLLPYAVMPPLLDPLIRLFGGFLPVLYLTAFLMVLVFPLLPLIKTRPHGKEASQKPSLTRAEVVENLKDRQIFSLLLISLLVYTAFAPVFFFLKGYALKVGIANPGWFFSLSTFMEIAVRLFAGTLLDKGSKVRSLAISLIALSGAYIFLAHTANPILFYGLGLAFGLCWGVAMPLMNGLIFDCSAPRFRALNTNLGMVMFQGGFFLGPLFGGWIIGDGSFHMLYYICSFMILTALLLLPFVRGKKLEDKKISC